MIKLRNLKEKDLNDYLLWNHPDRAFHKMNWPYFKQKTEEELKSYVEELRKKFKNWEKNVLENKKIIVNFKTDEIIWEVNWYWKSEETFWMEAWIVIFNEKYWRKWIWTIAFKMWIDELFEENPKIIRLWLTTWSWNIAMMKLAEKLWFQKEAVYRKARILNWKYYDSVSYWILKEEWENLKL